MALYSEKVMDHFRNPRNVGLIEDADGVGEVGNAVCGDIMKIYLKIEDGIVSDVKFETFGCGSAIASSSMATELIKGKPLSEALQLTNCLSHVCCILVNRRNPCVARVSGFLSFVYLLQFCQF